MAEDRIQKWASTMILMSSSIIISYDLELMDEGSTKDDLMENYASLCIKVH
jgi:hypothetical protein